MSVKVVDHGYDRMMKNIRSWFARKAVTLGVHGDAGSRNVMLANIHEFGTDTIPARSFILAWADEREAEINKTLTEVVTDAVKTNKSPQMALKRFTLWCVGDIKRRIANGIAPPNAASTIKRKGSSKPLIDTGQLRASIRGKVDGQ